MSDQQTGFVQIGGEKLHYLKLGAGRRLLVAFHGYRNNASLFIPFDRYLNKDFTIICIDLPHHGKSSWPDTKELSNGHLVELVHQLKREFNVEKLSLAGYSIGATDIHKLDENGQPYNEDGSIAEQKLQGMTAGLGAGYILPGNLPFNFGLRYQHVFVSGDPSPNIVSFRVSYSLSLFGRRSDDQIN